MRDCDNVTMRERLPDLLHGTLDGSARADVERHVTICADCAQELELLRIVRASAGTPRVDVQRIVAALPAYHATPARRRTRMSALWLTAAAVLLVAGGAALWAKFAATPAPSANSHVAVTPRPPAASSVAAVTSTPAVPALGVHEDELSLGEPITDLSDGDLRALAAVMDNLSAIPSEEIDNPVSSFTEGDS